jgi:hypothetical protein
MSSEDQAGSYEGGSAFRSAKMLLAEYLRLWVFRAKVKQINPEAKSRQFTLSQTGKRFPEPSPGSNIEFRLTGVAVDRSNFRTN